MSEFDFYEPVEDDAPHIKYMDLVRKHWTSLVAIKELLEIGSYHLAQDIWEHDVPYSERLVLWKAPTKGFGSIWETWERDALKNGEIDPKRKYRANV